MLMSSEENLHVQIQQHQSEDEDLKPLFTLLEAGPYKDFWLRGGLLYKQRDGLDLLVVPKCMESQIIKEHHENGHGGVNKVEWAIKQKYYIKSLKEKVKKYVSNCVL